MAAMTPPAHRLAGFPHASFIFVAIHVQMHLPNLEITVNPAVIPLSPPTLSATNIPCIVECGRMRGKSAAFLCVSYHQLDRMPAQLHRPFIPLFILNKVLAR